MEGSSVPLAVLLFVWLVGWFGVFCFVFEMGYHYVAQTGPKLLGFDDPP